MTKTIYYTYLGINGTITSIVELPDIYKIKTYQLVADEDCVLTNGIETVKMVSKVSEDNLSTWREIPDPNK